MATSNVNPNSISWLKDFSQAFMQYSQAFSQQDKILGDHARLFQQPKKSRPKSTVNYAPVARFKNA